ncbi:MULTISPECIES: adenylate/guanylate cyclase domain-containing protein [unclassified Sinorhizobium]|uniref:adenylate/guanylate cyclase domain-containing protein n=1 Tax=unclassified Sinorhizobium TaxID=2613772 RepID=UPI0024C294DB|nr:MULTISPECIES: adenylate/guanylate cyclase domain-containing protein [unclassified Sinorhizobium]MDK1373612.1 tetratricopeptide repeat protein [Sinorhizobium sp. 6-70]MDK1482308.1 tetratricopeptide repeat protein [Sinorhizobium sp. 6-117]
MKRRLAAILDADFSGYSRMMRHDEAGTFAALKAHQTEVILPAIAGHGGRVVKHIGDGLLAEFSSVVEAVTSAVEIQRAMLRRNETVNPDRHMHLRIGIHLGDVIVEEDGIHGDGVIVAARLQEIAPPGGICLSQQVHDHIGAKLDIPMTDLGRCPLADIRHPVRAWRWTPDEASGTPAAARADRGARSDRPPSARTVPDRKRPSIAVLPFINLSSVDEQEHFADGFTEELIHTLARCRWLQVVARNSSFAYKGKPVDVRKAAEDLGVKYVIEGSVRRSGDRIRITAQLLRAESATLLWAERYDRTLDDLFVLQDEIAGEITGTVEPELGIIEFAALRGQTAADMDAWDIYLKGLWHLYKFNLDDLKIAKDLFERATGVDPTFAQAYARLAYVHIQLGWYGAMDERGTRIADAIRLAERAIALDSREPAAHLALGRALALRGQPERGIRYLRTALELDASFAQGHFALGQALCYVECPEDGIAEINEAFRLSPRDPHLWTFHNMLAIAHYQSGRLTEAEAAARASLRQENTTFWPAMVLTAVVGAQGNAEAARAAVSELLKFRPEMTLEKARAEFYFGGIPAMPEHFIDRFATDLERAGLAG